MIGMRTTGVFLCAVILEPGVNTMTKTATKLVLSYLTPTITSQNRSSTDYGLDIGGTSAVL
jgi:hypothetical protein